MKKFLQVIVLIFAVTFSSHAKDGMWLPVLLQLLNEQEMKEMGMQITADDIYSINHASLKDAIMIFGGGCTSELVSNQGLLLTNYHCGYGNIQRHSSIDHDYLTDGFWAQNKGEELPCPGLTTSLMVEMRDVTDRVNAALNENMSQDERAEAIKAISKEITDEATADNHYDAIIESYFHDNQFFLIVYEIFTDIRLVGAPPSNIGKFGGDTDNWVWPRHTGDFSVFRVYTGADNKPANYSPENKPYQPKKYLNISLEGVEEGNFTFVFGYPGSTNEYAHSGLIYNTVEVYNPTIISVRDMKLDVMKAHSELSPLVRIQYANKIAGIANGWKKMIGQSLGINKVNGVEMKRDFEKEFQKWANNTKYASVLSELDETYKNICPLRKDYLVIAEAGIGTEVVEFAGSFRKLVAASKKDEIDMEEIEKLKSRLKNEAIAFYKDYNVDIDRELCPQLFEYFYENIDPSILPEELNKYLKKSNGNFDKYADIIFSKTMMADSNVVYSFIDNYKPKQYKTIEKDPCYIIFTSMLNALYDEVIPQYSEYQNTVDSLMRHYMKAQMEFEKERTFYPDANFTLRVSYGKVDGFYPDDAVKYKHFTTLEGIIEKENPDIYDYVVEDRLKELYNKKDYGRYADKDGSLHTCFIASNHTTGGNSGSPVLNAKGELIGLNFDRNWQGTMSDLIYDPDMCRNIIVDIRYVLFIIDKFAGASHIVDEMKIANSKLMY